MLRVVITDAAGRRVTAEKFITCRDCTPAAMRVAARSASPFGSAESGFTSTSALFSSGFFCGTGVNSTTASRSMKGTSITQGFATQHNSSDLLHHDSDEQNIPSVVTLEQNSPNPFNSETSIGFSIPEASEISLAVYDTFGRSVLEVWKGGMNRGRHQFTVLMNTLPSGIYSYRLTVNGRSLARQMLYVR